MERAARPPKRRRKRLRNRVQLTCEEVRLEAAAEDTLMLDVQALVFECMARRQISQAQLAARLGVSQAYVSNLLRNLFNMKLRGLARLFHALGASPVVTIRDPQAGRPRRDNMSASVGLAAPPVTRSGSAADSAGPPSAGFPVTEGRLSVEQLLEQLSGDHASSHERHC
jgi:transcriptional regulator with XRE-family HTH domain